ncbi:exosortase [Aeromonas sp. RU39B]|jgi:exosortase|uniref:exosortase n=1 Tax=Aeromonas sp. RU39B TaxID=1907416 RepID=UPI000955ED02|nr:exosortase [Aeromonas sp. RU39B]SIQ60840.1 exosortase [Aeromonas sp. RU39B]
MTLRKWPFSLHLSLALLALTCLYGPLFNGLYFADPQSVGGSTAALLLMVALGLFVYQLLQCEPSTRPDRLVGGLALLLGALLYLLGDMLQLPMFSVSSLIVMLAALILLYFGRAKLRPFLLPLALLLFVIPLPFMLTDVIVQPLKLLVSHVTETLLYLLGYPVARQGVVLILGPYQLLVADACSGINSLFSLEAIALLYLHVVKREGGARKLVIALLIVPISITANVLRVLFIALLTYHEGNDIAQSFVHELSGLFLFVVALMLIITLDGLLDRLAGRSRTEVRG